MLQKDSPSAPGSHSRKLHDRIRRALVATSGAHRLLHMLYAFAIHRVIGDTLNRLAQRGGVDGFFLRHDAQSHVHGALRMQLLFGLLGISTIGTPKYMLSITLFVPAWVTKSCVRGRISSWGAYAESR